MTKTHIILCFAFFWQFALHAQEGVQVDESYKGYRLFVTNVQLIKNKSAYKKVQFDLINTGRQKISISERRQIPKEWIQLKFDNTWTDLKLSEYIAQFKTALVAQNLTLEVGQMLRTQELKFSTAPEVVTTIAKTTDKPKQEKEPLVEKTPIKEDVDSVTHKEESIAEEKKSKAKEPKPKKEKEEVKLPSIPVTAIATSIDGCADLVFENVTLIKQNKRYATLQYTVKNIGDGPAKMLGKTDEIEDNIAIRAYISGIPQLTRGALTLGGTFIKDGFNETNPTLKPNQTHTAQIRLDITKRTRYMNNLILSLDDYYTIQECDKTNNVFVVQL